MLVTLSGMLMQVRESHPLKVLFPMLVTLSGMLMLVREWQFEKACFPILFTLLGMLYVLLLPIYAIMIGTQKTPILQCLLRCPVY